MSWRRWVLLALAGGLAGVGCGGPMYQNGRTEAAAISPRSSWRASGDLRSVSAAIDHDIGTAAVSSDPDGRGTITIHLGKACLFNMVIIEHGSNEMGFARRVTVSTSMDGQTFTPRYTGPGTRRVTLLYLGSPALARYVRIQAVIGGDRPWSVAEVYLE